MFKDELEKIVNQVEGGLAAVLMGFDGILVEQYIRPENTESIEELGIELGVILKNIQGTAKTLEVGVAKEVSIKAEKISTILRYLNEDYFVALAIKPNGNSGKARYLLRIGEEKILRDL